MKNPNKDPAFLSQVPIRYQVLPLASREWKNGSDSSYNCTPFLHSLLAKGKVTYGLYWVGLLNTARFV